MRQQWADYRVFLREFRRTFESTGAVLPSGPALSDTRSPTSCGKDARPALSRARVFPGAAGFSKSAPEPAR